MTTPLPKYWSYENEVYKLVCLASANRDNEPYYILEHLNSGMNTAFHFHTTGLRAIGNTYEEDNASS